MRLGTLIPVAAMLMLLGRAAAIAADAPVTLTKPAPQAFPRIASAADEAAKRIDAALDRQDARLRKVAADCIKDGGHDASWTRTVTAPMTGPAYLTLIAADDFFCGGAYPDTAQLVLVYDLQTGSPVNWTRLLPAAIAGTATLQEGADGSKIGTLNSPKLHTLYAQSYPKGPDQAECLDSIATAPFTLWPDAKADGLMIAPFGLPHVIAACAEPVLLPTALLQTMGVDIRLTNAIFRRA